MIIGGKEILKPFHSDINWSKSRSNNDLINTMKHGYTIDCDIIMSDFFGVALECFDLFECTYMAAF